MTAGTKQQTSEQAIDDFAARWHKAVSCLSATHIPPGQRTHQAMLCFKGLRLDGMPPKLRRALDSCFGNINRILASYDIRTAEDYETISKKDLDRIGKLLIDIV